MNTMNKTIYLKSATVLISLIMTACTSIPKDGGISDVQSLLGDKLNPGVILPISGQENQFSTQQIDQMISEPLTLVNAEQLSISQNPLVRVKLSQVGVAAADYAQAGRMENPGFSYGRFTGQDYDASLLFDIGGVILMPLKRQLELRRLNTAKYKAAADVLEHIANTRRIWINAVAAKQQTALMLKALESVEAGNNLTRQMSALGHSSIIEAADSEIFLSEMRTSLSRQQLSEASAKEALVRQ
jgi:outer membrane protein TolC